MNMRFLDVPIPMAQVLRLYNQMLLSYGLYVCIILEKLLIIGLFLEYFATLLKRQYLKKIAANVPYFFTDCTFLWEGQGHFLEIRIKFHLGRTKGRGKGVWGRSPK